MATRVRPSRSRVEPPQPNVAPRPEPVAPEPDAQPAGTEPALRVDVLGLWLWLGGAGILVLLHVLAILGSLFGWGR